MRRYGLRDDQWDRIKNFLPVPWRDLPERFGDWKVVYQRFSRWAKSGIFERIFKLFWRWRFKPMALIRGGPVGQSAQETACVRRSTRASLICTHFLALLTPVSIAKPWVNQEMDAGLVKKLDEETRFIAVRSNLPAGALPPLLKGMLSPAD
jgi:hypothetical protein